MSSFKIPYLQEKMAFAEGWKERQTEYVNKAMEKLEMNPKEVKR